MGPLQGPLSTDQETSVFWVPLTRDETVMYPQPFHAPPSNPLILVSCRLTVTTTAKLDGLVAVPPGVVTLIVPVVTPAGATAMIEVALFTEKL